MKGIKKTNIYIIFIILVLFIIFTFTLSDDNLQTNSTNSQNSIESENINKVNNTTEQSNNRDLSSQENLNTNNLIINKTQTEEKPKENNEEKKIDENQNKTKEEIEKKIEETIKDNLKENNDNVDILNKYKDFNLTDAIEKQYDDYQDDKDSDYFKNIDDLDDKKTKKKKSKKDVEEDKYNQEWDDKVSKLHAHDLLTLNLRKKDYEVFFEQIDQVPVTITTAYYVHEEKNKIDFEIINPKKKTIFKLKSKNRGFYEFEVKEAGKYEFILSNERNKKTNKVTFALHTTKEDMKSLNMDHIQKLFYDVDKVHGGIREISFNQKMLNRKFEAHFEKTIQHNKNITFWSILETVVMSGILLIQLFYIKYQVENH